jgi:succinyl-CoA synthetase beta subunit/citryl-CoA synthetase large subunit
MARVLENIGKELLKKNGIPVPEFQVAESPALAREAADQIGYPVVVKALVPMGKRGKAGAVKFASSGEEAEEAAGELFGMTVHNFPVESVLVEKKIAIAQEIYTSITFDNTGKSLVLIASSEGGMDIEEVAARSPDKVIKHPIDPLKGLNQYEAKEICSELGMKGKTLQNATQVVWRLYRTFAKYEATILEVNPLAVTAAEEVIAAAILMGVDDDALYRQPELSGKVEAGSDRAWRPLTDLEKEMIAVDSAESYRGTARYTEMEGGDIGFLCGGGGGSLLAYDALLQCGGQPANYTELGGNPTETKVAGIVKGVLSKPGVKSFFSNSNITNNTQTDLVAKGIIMAFKEKNIDPWTFPCVVRLAGVNEKDARETFSGTGVEYYGDEVTMEDAAMCIVNKMKQVYGE